jgi:hypothetical protein
MTLHHRHAANKSAKTKLEDKDKRCTDCRELPQRRTSELLPCAPLLFQRLQKGQFPAWVRLDAQTTRVKCATAPGRNTADRTPDRGPVVLYQDRTAINDNSLPSAESFLHQEQIGSRDLGSIADSANGETIAHALV